jgi:hypothetical protein
MEATTKDDWMSEEEHQRAPATASSDQPADPLFQRVRIIGPLKNTID